MRTRLGITQKLTLIFVVFAAVLVLGVGLFLYSSGQVALEEAVESELESIAAEKEAALLNWLDERLSEIVSMSLLPGIRQDLSALQRLEAGSDEAQVVYFQLIERLTPRAGENQPFVSINIMEPKNGEVIASTNPLEEGKFYENRPFFIEGKKSPYTQSLYYSVSIQQPAITVSAPINSTDGRLLGVIAGRLNLAELYAIINPVSLNRETLDAYIVTQSNLFATQPRFMEDTVILQRGIRTAAVDACIAGGKGITEGLDYQNVAVITSYRWLADENMCLIVEMQQAEAFSGIQSLAKTIVLIAGTILLVATLIATALARTITQPLLRLKEAALRLGKGEWDYRVPTESTDELGSLAREFNHMADVLSENEARLREQTRLLLDSNQQLEAFSYSVSHDLRAPLRSVDGFSRILLEDYSNKLDDDGKRYITIVRDGAQQMGKLIDDLLAFSRISRQSISTQEINVEKLVNEIAESAKKEEENRNIEIEIGSLPTCHADSSLVRQVFQNLLSNAIKYTRNREIAYIEVGAKMVDGDTVYYVRDNGAGFDMKYADKLFGVFQRLHRADEFEGTGVGLAIVRRIINRHSGRIWADAEVDKGATFFFTLPHSNAAILVDEDNNEEEINSLIERARDLI
jgi:signal transduction histidine kinase